MDNTYHYCAFYQQYPASTPIIIDGLYETTSLIRDEESYETLKNSIRSKFDINTILKITVTSLTWVH